MFKYWNGKMVIVNEQMETISRENKNFTMNKMKILVLKSSIAEMINSLDVCSRYNWMETTEEKAMETEDINISYTRMARI